jgi:hypothetical protein
LESYFFHHDAGGARIPINAMQQLVYFGEYAYNGFTLNQGSA